MTVMTTNRRQTYIGDGVTTAFPVPFPFASNINLNLLRTIGGVTSTLALSVDYNVAGAGNELGGTVTLLVAPPVAARLTIRRQSSLTQLTDYTSNDPFPAEAHERALDLLTMITQELTDDLSRAVLVGEEDAAIGDMLLPSVAARENRLLAFDDDGLPIPGPTSSDVVAAIAIALAEEAATVAQNVVYTPPFTGGVASNLFHKSRERLSAFDFMTTVQITDVRAGTLLQNVTAPLQAAITAAAATGQVLHIPAGRYLTGALTMANDETGRVIIDMDTQAELAAATTSMTILSMGTDAERDGPRMVRGGRFNGRGLANVTGIAAGGVNALLYARLQDVYVTGCDEAVALRNVQEMICDGLISFGNRVGFVCMSEPTSGGTTVLQWYGCRFQNNTVGFFGKSNSVFPVGGWLFSGCTFQTNTINGMALYGEGSGNAAIVSVTLDNVHFEAIGALTSPGDTATVRSVVVPRSGVLLDGARASATSGELGQSLLPESFRLRNGAQLTVRDAVIGGGSINQFDCDASSTVYLEGRNVLTGSGSGIQGWSGFYWGGLGGGVMSGIPALVPTPQVPNAYAGAGLNPNVPEVGNTIGATASKVLDATHGQVARCVYLASAGSTGANRSIIAAISGAFPINGIGGFSMLVRASVATDLTFRMQGDNGTLFSGVARLRAGWNRVIGYGRAQNAETNGYNLFMFPADSAGATLDFAKMMVYQGTAIESLDTINNVLRLGWYDDMLAPIYAPAIPTSGTWPRGKRIINSVPTLAAAKSWVKVTTGATNVLATDWISEGDL